MVLASRIVDKRKEDAKTEAIKWVELMSVFGKQSMGAVW